ncbi:carbohydrate ABC transporter permease [Brachybacterium sp. ACRRE]|uniref:carbohydrate ABC transporter permease n=1 Tax=Brachybacterium sp. ACRRE TaxID=2918184 RepID=UPI001EF25EB3|nr:sugar ABC transporter permease [Brachybacterium sp. ACRRE]MCG7310717.1 sugar ABC transporter permease [Brachybacterium sp. ACRRE]
MMITKSPRRALLWIAPALILVLALMYVPLVQNFRLSFYDWSIFDQEMNFVGLKNYRQALADPFLGTALRNNIAYAAVSVVIQVGFGLVLASLLDRFAKGRLQAFLRSVYFLPATISMTVTGVLFTFVYDPEAGILNSALGAVGLESLTRAWLAEPSTAMGSIIAMSQWQWTGYITALLLVAIQRIPSEYYEAAALDGAGPVRQFVSVTVPLTREMVAILSLVTVSNALLLFNEVIVMTNGGPNNSTQVLGTIVYQNAFVNDRMGYAATMSTLVLVLTMGLGVAQMIWTRRKRVSL